jgi:hypothetical protein
MLFQNLIVFFCLNASLFHEMNFDKLNNFEEAMKIEDFVKMDENFQPNNRNNFYLDVALEEGKDKIVDYFIEKGYQPSLFANQMARLNGYTALSNKIESYVKYRNKINIKDVFYTYDSKMKSIYWSPVIPVEHRF